MGIHQYGGKLRGWHRKHALGMVKNQVLKCGEQSQLIEKSVFQQTS